MKLNLNLSSEIVLNRVPIEIYQPATAIDRSELTRYEKLNTNIFANETEGAKHIANSIANIIRSKQEEGKFCVLGLGTGLSLTPIFDELISQYKAKKLSFHNVVIFNAYEYFH